MRRIVFLVGMHRSGISAIAASLTHCGFGEGARLPDIEVRRGEAVPPGCALTRLDAHLLSLVGARWDRIALTRDIGTLEKKSVGEFLAQIGGAAAEGAWDEAFGGTKGDIVHAAPNLALTLPLWVATAARKGFRPDVVLVHRNPVEIMASLEDRDNLRASRSAALIVDNWLAMLDSAPDDARVISYKAFASDPIATLAALDIHPTSPQDAEEIAGMVEARRTYANLATAMQPAPLRLLDGMLSNAHLHTPPANADALDVARRDFENRKLFADETFFLGEVPALPAAPAFVGRNDVRPVVLHCHIFKNAGSSVDVLLKKNFCQRWATKEFTTRGGASNADLTNSYIRATETFDALSTHTGDWWFGHNGKGIDVLPIIFLRHPLLRIRSAYSFERKQDADTMGARLAKEHDFEGYVRARLDRPNDLAFRNFQTRRLAAFESRHFADLRSNALQALDKVPFLGIVEDFEASAHRLASYLAPHFPGFKAHQARANITDTSDRSADEKVDLFRTEIGEQLFNDIMEANSIDFEIYSEAVARFSQRPSL